LTLTGTAPQSSRCVSPANAADERIARSTMHRPMFSDMYPPRRSLLLLVQHIRHKLRPDEMIQRRPIERRKFGDQIFVFAIAIHFSGATNQDLGTKLAKTVDLLV